MPSLSMSRSQREAFLAGTHVAIVSVADGARGPLTLPVWYRYEPGAAVRFVTGATSRKLGLIKKAGRVTLCVQTETAFDVRGRPHPEAALRVRHGRGAGDDRRAGLRG